MGTLNMHRAQYASLSALAVVAALLGPVAGLAAAAPQSAVTAPPATADRSPVPALTASATASSVRASQQFRIQGTSRHLPPGTPITLQQKQGGRWVDLPASVNTTSQGTYTMRVLLDLAGRNALRMVGGGAVSPVVYVTVRP
ncbi:hypothetical protein AB0B50_06870 [Streptomyces sp. NPDC041068]|uniref:hypothetical protein n=1 Tax=Streptomyces sp. NPDC041068 TaxID=3155130 RepID=UPI0033D33AC7